MPGLDGDSDSIDFPPWIECADEPAKPRRWRAGGTNAPRSMLGRGPGRSKCLLDECRFWPRRTAQRPFIGTRQGKFSQSESDARARARYGWKVKSERAHVGGSCACPVYTFTFTPSTFISHLSLSTVHRPQPSLARQARLAGRAHAQNKSRREPESAPAFVYRIARPKCLAASREKRTRGRDQQETGRWLRNDLERRCAAGEVAGGQRERDQRAHVADRAD